MQRVVLCLAETCCCVNKERTCSGLKTVLVLPPYCYKLCCKVIKAWPSTIIFTFSCSFVEISKFLSTSTEGYYECSSWCS